MRAEKNTGMAEFKRPSLAYYRRHVRAEYLEEYRPQQAGAPARPDEGIAVEAAYHEAQAGTPMAAYLTWLYWREQAEFWIERSTNPIEPSAEMWRSFWAYQQTLTGKEHAVDLLSLVPWWWETYQIIDWPLDSGNYHQLRPGTEPPTYVLAYLSSPLSHPHAATEEREQAATRTPGVVPTTLPVPRARGFTPGALTITSDKFTQLVLQASWDAANRDFSRWTRQYTSPPYYQDDEERTLYVSDMPVSATSVTVLSPEQEAKYWETVLSLDDDKVSAFVISLGKWFADRADLNLRDPQGNPILAKTRIHVSDVLGFQGVKPHHKGGFRREQKQKVADDIWTLNRIFVTGPQVVYETDRRGRRHEKTVTVHSRLIEVSMESEHDLLGDEHPYALNIAPGDWARPYVLHDGRMVAQLLRPVMEYDPRQGVGLKAMRLGLYLSFQWRIRSSHGNYAQPWKVETLLVGSRVLTEREREDRRYHQRVREQCEAALDRLQSDGVIGAWEYNRWDEEALDGRGWFRRWLQWTVAITPPSSVVAHYAQIEKASTRAIAAAKRTSRTRTASSAGR